MKQLVGRSDELGILGAELRAARAGALRVVLIEGAPGMGKSSLLAAALEAALADDPSFPVVTAVCAEEEVALRWSLADQLVSGLKSEADGTVHTAETTVGQGSCWHDHDDSAGAGAELLRLLGERSRTGPVALVIEDAQWADPASLLALLFVARRLQRCPVIAFVLSRDGLRNEVSGLRRLAAERGVVLSLDPLSVDDVVHLAGVLGRELPRRAVSRLREHTAGSPLLLRAFLGDLSDADLARPVKDVPVPASVTELIASRLAPASEPERSLVEAASVLGSGCALDIVARCAGVEDPAQPLTAAAARGLLVLREAPFGLTVGFPCAAVRAAVYDSLTLTRRTELHTSAGGLLVGARGLHHRAAAALRGDDAIARDLARQGRAELAEGDTPAAGRHLVWAAHLSRTADERERFLLEGVELLLAGGVIREASSLLPQLEAMAPSPRSRYVRGHLALLEGRQHDAEELLLQAWGTASECEPAIEAEASEGLARLCAMQVRPAEAIKWARCAIEGSAVAVLDGSALAVLVVNCALVGHPAQAMALVDGLPESSREPKAGDVAGVRARAIVRMWTGDVAGALTDLRWAVEAAPRQANSASRLLALGFLAQAEYLAGDWAACTVHAEDALASATEAGQAWLVPLLHATASWPLGPTGAWDAAEMHVRAARDSARRIGDVVSLAYAEDAEVRLAWCREDHGRLLDATRRLLALPGRELVDEPGALAWRELQADTLLQVGQLAEAERVLDGMETMLDTRPCRRLAWVHLARLCACLEGERGRFASAFTTFEAALSYSQLSATPFERARVEEAYGRALQRAGKRRAAAARLLGARTAFAEMGASPLVARVERELRGCGLPTGRRRRDRASIAALTPRELAVAALVSDGLTNKEISARLAVSTKTVEYHLGHIFTKLGVTSRRQVRSHLPRQDADGDVIGLQSL